MICQYLSKLYSSLIPIWGSFPGIIPASRSPWQLGTSWRLLSGRLWAVNPAAGTFEKGRGRFGVSSAGDVSDRKSHEEVKSKGVIWSSSGAIAWFATGVFCWVIRNTFGLPRREVPYHGAPWYNPSHSPVWLSWSSIIPAFHYEGAQCPFAMEEIDRRRVEMA